MRRTTIIAPLLVLLACLVGTGMVEAQYQHYTLKITSPSSGTVNLASGQTLGISGTLTYDNNPTSSPNAVTIMSESKVIGSGSNVYQGGWTATVSYTQLVGKVGTGTHEFYATWTGDTWGVSTWSSQGHVFFVNLLPITYTLTASVSPAGTGTFSFTPPGPTYVQGTVVTVIATAASGYELQSWSGDVPPTVLVIPAPSTIQITMDSNKSITANFTAVVNKYALTTSVSPSGAGTVTPSGTTYYDPGKVVDVAAIAASGYYFSSWSGDASGNIATTQVTMNSNKSITANFTQSPPSYTLTTGVLPSASAGTISLNPPGGTYLQGTAVTATANPNSGWQFDHWSGDASGTGSPQITMVSNKSITANFVQIPTQENYILNTYVVIGQGTVSPSGSNSYPSGNSVTITATPSSGWAFDHWTDDLSGSQNPATVIMNSNKTVGAYFVQKTPSTATLTMVSSPVEGGTVQASLAQVVTATYPVGSTVILTAFPNQGYAFDSWSGDATGTSATTSIKMDTDKVVIANFKQQGWLQTLQQYQIYIIVGVLVIAIVATAVIMRRK